MSKSDLQHLASLKGTPLEYMISPDHPQVSTLIGDVQIASTLSYQVQTEKFISALMYKAIGYFDIYYATISNIGSH